MLSQIMQDERVICFAIAAGDSACPVFSRRRPPENDVNYFSCVFFNSLILKSTPDLVRHRTLYITNARLVREIRSPHTHFYHSPT
jgi:hypothetical protein